MARDLTSIFSELTVIKSHDLEECNRELENAEYNSIVRKALMTYKAELQECLDMYSYYLKDDGEDNLTR